MKCGISAGPDASEEKALEQLRQCKHMSDHTTIGEQVSVDEVEVHNAEGDGATVALVDCGAKGSIISSLVEREATVHVFPTTPPGTTSNPSTPTCCSSRTAPATW